MTTPADATGSGEVERATTLELFLDLVFVFTVTQLTSLVSHPTGLADYGKGGPDPGRHVVDVRRLRVADRQPLDGPAGLPHGRVRRHGRLPAHGPRHPRRLRGHGRLGRQRAGLRPGLPRLAALHAGLFATAPNASAQAIRRIAPFNFGAAALVLLAAFLPVDWRWVGWLGALAVVASTSLFGRTDGWSVSA